MKNNKFRLSYSTYSRVVYALVFLLVSTIFLFCDTKVETCYSIDEARKNYELNKQGFHELVNFIELEKIITNKYISFNKDGVISCSLYNVNIRDSTCLIISEIDKSVKDIKVSDSGELQINYIDSISVYSNWSWSFEGSQNSIGYYTVLDYLSITKRQIDSLENFVSKINCQSVQINKGGEIILGFCGLPMCQAQYILIKSEDFFKKDFIRIDTNVYFGVYKDSLVTGDCILTK